MYSLTGRILCQPLYRKIYIFIKRTKYVVLHIYTIPPERITKKVEGEGFAPPLTAPNAK